MLLMKVFSLSRRGWFVFFWEGEDKVKSDKESQLLLQFMALLQLNMVSALSQRVFFVWLFGVISLFYIYCALFIKLPET